MNPRIKKIGRNILFLLSIPGIIGAFVFANSNKQDEKLHGIHVEIENTELSFITTDDIQALIRSNHVEVNKSVISEIRIHALENKIRENKWVKDAEMFISANHDINIKVSQRVPKVRIHETDSNGYTYYLDENIEPIELSEQYIAKVPVVTAADLGYNTTEDMQLKMDLVKLATYIQADPFWNTMISQINVNDQQQIELIPTLGNHLIQLGTADDLDNKMKRLLAFYQNGLTTLDWNRYDEIDVRFARQVVARNTHVKELVNKTIEAARIEMLKEQREKYLKAVSKKKADVKIRKADTETKAKSANTKPITH